MAHKMTGPAACEAPKEGGALRIPNSQPGVLNRPTGTYDIFLSRRSKLLAQITRVVQP